MAERDNRRQTGNQLFQQDGQDDATWGFNAANAASLGAFPFDLNGGTPVLPPAAKPPSLTQYQQIVFIEGDVPNARQLAAGVSAGTLAVILDPNGDGLAQIAAFLTSHDVSNLTAIDIVAHGSDGTVRLGTGTLSSASLAGYQTDLTTIGAALQSGGDLQIFGCDVAQDASGVAFLDQLSAATGGANVVAASHLVGAASGGGSWNLDVNTGAIDTAGSPFTAATEDAYTAELPAAGTSELFLGLEIEDAGGTPDFDKMAVSGSSTATGVTVLNSGTPTLSNVYGVMSSVIEAPQGKYYISEDPEALGEGSSTAQILVGTFGSSTLTAPSYLNFGSSTSISPWGIVESSNPSILYVGNYDGANSADNGIWQINVTTGAASPVAVSSAVNGPLELAFDQTNSLVFFTDNYLTTTQIDVANVSTGKVQIFDTATSGVTYYGIAVNAGTVYFDGGYEGSVDAIYDATYTLSGGNVTLGAIHTLYSITEHGSVEPTSLVIDPANNAFYVGAFGNTSTWSVWEGSLGGSSVQANLIKVYSASNSYAPETDALALETTPTVTASGTLSYTQGHAATVLDSSATAVNSDNEGLASATVAITNFATGDTLSAVTSGTSITASFSAGTLTLSGADTAAHYQTVLDSVAIYSVGTAGTRNLNWTISDGQLSSATDTSSVTVGARESVVAGATATFTGGSGSSVALDSGLTVTDSSSANLVSATVVIGGFITGDTLTVGTTGGLSQSFSNGTLTLSGSASVGTYQTALDSVAYTFTPANGDPTGGGSHTSRAISWFVNDGTVTSAAATSTLNEVHVAPTLTAGGTVTYTGPSAVTLDSTVTVSDTDSGGNLTGATVSVGTGFSTGDTLAFVNQNGITGSYNAASGILTLSGTATIANYRSALGSVAYDTTNASHAARTIDWTTTDGAASSPTSTSTVDVICFCKGTLIGTPDGEVRVQTLKAGDMVLTLHNGPRKVSWVGAGKVLATRGRRSVATPVIVRRGALADNVPRWDLRVTKAHSLYIENVLIPVEFLVNHKTILWDDHAREVEIYHVELESHDVLIANGAPAESYRDDGNRWLFQNANEGWHLPPQQPYAPVLTGGPLVDAVWRRLLDRAGPRDLPPLTDDPDLHLIVNGIRVNPTDRREGMYAFRLPSRPASVIVASRQTTPAEFGIARDPRPLGVALRKLTVRQGAKFMLFDADDDRLTAGFHGYEPSEQLRWTEGFAELPIEAFARFDEGAIVTLYLGGATSYPEYTEQAAA
jgi:hypothetical protein